MKSVKVEGGDKVTVSGVGVNLSGDLIVRATHDNKEPPFWGINQRTGKRGKAVKLQEFTADWIPERS